jgi:hypothetical protein
VVRRLAVVVFAGCASAGTPEQAGVDASTPPGDSGSATLDGAITMGDAGPQTVTLSQTTSQTIKGANTIACQGTIGGTTAANNYYRVFDLPALGVTTAFTVTKVSFQVEHCQALSGTACTNVAVRVGLYTAAPGTTLDISKMTILASNATVAVPRVVQTGTTTPGGTVDAPITATIPAGSRLLVEVDAPNSGTYAFYMGSNDGGESALGYILAPDCSVTTPTNISGSFGTNAPATPRHLLLTVTGTK